jgi:putative transposase
MTAPRMVLPDTDHLITRRCSERRFFLRPDEATNNAFLYCLGLALTHSRVELLFVVAMSNHYHAGIHDPHGTFPDFLTYFHGLLARCLNCHRDRGEGFWSTGNASDVMLVEPEDVLDKMIYAYANPCAADLVATAEQWPGVHSFHAAMTTGRLTASRPAFFFRDNEALPESIVIPIARPCGFLDLSHDEWRQLVTQRLREAEAHERERRIRDGKAILGRQRILDQKPSASPGDGPPDFGLNPRVAAKGKWPRIEALIRLKAFLGAYAVAIKAWLSGVADVVFPFGTFRMRRLAHVACAPPEGSGDGCAGTCAIAGLPA